MKSILDQTIFKGVGDDNDVYDWSIALHQYMYTPTDSYSGFPRDGERPYSGWLGFEYGLNRHDDDTSTGFSISIGITGENSIAQEAQDFVHENVSRSPIFQGWNTQTPTEVTFNIHVNKKHRIEQLSELNFCSIKFDWFSEYGASLGNLKTSAYLGSLFRLGYNLPIDYSIPRLQAGATPPSFYTSDNQSISPFSCFTFISARASAVAHDISLDGPVFRDHDYTVESRPLVGELSVGLGLRYKRLSVQYSKTIRSDEFYGQNNDSHEFGSVLISLQL